MSSLNESESKQLRNLIECPLCLHNFEDPRVLQCSHTFCYACLQKLTEKDDSKCPLSDGTVIIRQEIQNLPVNLIAKNMVDYVSSLGISKMKNLSQKCDYCNEMEAVFWCENCPANYCESCKEKIHEIKTLKSHTTVPLSEKSQSFCTNHTGERIKYWCNQCQTLVCRDCLLFQHKDHQFSTLIDATTEAKAVLRTNIQQVKEIQQSLVESSNKTKDIITKEREMIENEKLKIENLFTTLQRQLHNRKHVLLQVLQNSELQTIDVLKQQQKMIDDHANLSFIQELCIKNMLESNDSIRILQYRSNFSQNHDNFIKQNEEINEEYCISRRQLEIDEEHLENVTKYLSSFVSMKQQMATIKNGDETMKLSLLNISHRTGEIKIIEQENNVARGYKFVLVNPIKLRSIQIEASLKNPVVAVIADEDDVIIQRTVVRPTNINMDWLRIPFEASIQNNYTVLVLPKAGDESYISRQGDGEPRVIYETCSVQSKYVWGLSNSIVGSKLPIDGNNYSINMILEIENDV